MITGAQIAASRVLLGWSLRDLARRAGLDLARVQEAETSAKMRKRCLRDLAAIQQTLQDAGIKFIDAVGVQLLPRELREEELAPPEFSKPVLSAEYHATNLRALTGLFDPHYARPGAGSLRSRNAAPATGASGRSRPPAVDCRTLGKDN